ncbi:MAG: hypothetical protein ACQKBY_05535, partial [Verrucomicrobiales bacterium]
MKKFLLLAWVGVGAVLSGAEPLELARWAGEGFETPVRREVVDEAAFAEWVGGEEKRIVKAAGKRSTEPGWVLWTRESGPGHAALLFGDTAEPGARHVRFGFTEELPVGSVLVSGGGKLSVLKEGVAYPGDLGNEDHWLAAERVEGAGEVGAGELALWVLPPEMKTRALRFTHVAALTDTTYAGRLGGVMVLPERWENVAGRAVASASVANEKARALVNGAHDMWGAWATQEKGKFEPEEAVISAENPAWVTLAWPEEVE